MDVLVVAESPTDRSRLCQLVAAVPGVDGLRQAASRADTVRALEERSPDLVLSDIRLCDGTVPRLVENLRGMGSPGVLVLTESPGDNIRRQPLPAGVERLLPKSDCGAIETAVREWNRGSKGRV